MNPVQTEQMFQRNPQRSVLCGHYNKCLDIAIERNWKNFACSECQDYELEAGGDPVHWRAQEWRAAHLLVEIAGGMFL
jgi:hypothetical protein